MTFHVYVVDPEVSPGENPRVSQRIQGENYPFGLVYAERMVSEFFGIKPDDFMMETRGRRNISDARQVMMYLAHVAFGLTLGEVGRLYNRDRSTVGYACRKMEDLRDNPRHDRLMDEFERAIRDKIAQARPGMETPCREHLSQGAVR